MLNITNKLYNAILNPYKKRLRPNSGFFPSSASIVIDGEQYGSCHRQEYYSWYRYNKSDSEDPETSLAAHCGDGLHKTIFDLISSTSLETNLSLVITEQPFYDKVYDISGRIDALVQDKSTNKLYGIEVKTVGEYKTGLTMLEPDICHVIQSMLYLDIYNRYIPTGNQKVEEWIILYLARSETYKTRHYKHGSPFKQLWQFSIKLEDNGSVTITNCFGVSQNKPLITIDKIYERYNILKEYIKDEVLPDREYEVTYSEEKIVGLFKENKVLNKKQKEQVQKWLDKGAAPGKLGLAIGDFECNYCPYLTKCYSSDPYTHEPEAEYIIKLPIAEASTIIEHSNFF